MPGTPALRLVTFEPFRSLGIPGVRYVKPDLHLDHLAVIRAGGATSSFAPAPAAALHLVTRIARSLWVDHAGFDVAMVGGRPRAA